MLQRWGHARPLSKSCRRGYYSSKHEANFLGLPGKMGYQQKIKNSPIIFNRGNFKHDYILKGMRHMARDQRWGRWSSENSREIRDQIWMKQNRTKTIILFLVLDFFKYMGNLERCFCSSCYFCAYTISNVQSLLTFYYVACQTIFLMVSLNSFLLTK